MRIETVSNLLTEPEAATVLRMRPRSLAALRRAGRGPRWSQPAGRVLYRRDDLLAWVDAAATDPVSA